MMGGLNPKKMQAIMKQMGMSQEQIPALRVIMEKEDGSRLIIDDPDVMKIKMNGQVSYQVTGQAHEETAEVEISKEDIKIVMEKTGKSSKEAKEALEKYGDLTEAILELSD
ncbi:MAG TPA: hypothetical protein HA283_04745 [Nanoarchaeota archaeon]|nr:hypothetical protein [Nanoarchaeota archaeon]HIH63576.1 hypothetical protein [Nanoarchaeota archaeon]HIJ10169.1 hypothetical protein [Nanoarchaeota archaeon]